MGRSRSHVRGLIALVVSTNSLSSATPMNVARGEFRWVRLNDGRIFAAGGCCDRNGSLSSAEIYDPVAKTWAMTASMSKGRFDLSLVKLRLRTRPKPNRWGAAHRRSP